MHMHEAKLTAAYQHFRKIKIQKYLHHRLAIAGTQMLLA